jgi:hypothetical protein
MQARLIPLQMPPFENAIISNQFNVVSLQMQLIQVIDL